MNRRGILVAVCFLVLTVAALGVRLARLGQRPMHGDEANQAVKAGILWETGQYAYDPEEHHGPSLYWITLYSLWSGSAFDFAGSTESDYRIVLVVFGTGLILLLLLVADGLGWVAVVIAAALTAISPAMVYYSRYYVQEMLLVFFTAAAIGCGWRYCRSRSTGWAVATGAMIGLMHATKETWVLAAAAAAIGLALTLLWARRRDGAWPEMRPFLRPVPVLAALGAACVVAVLLYSSFGRNWSGPLDSVLAYTTYARRGAEAGIHRHEWYYYLELLTAFHPAKRFFWTEGLIVGLAVIGAGASLFGRPKHKLPVFLAFYTIALTAIYSLIPYKTPWCMLSFLAGMILLAGVGAEALVGRVFNPSTDSRRVMDGLKTRPTRFVLRRLSKGLAVLLLLAGLVHLGWECYWLNFRLAADTRNPYVYAHSAGDVLNLAAQMDRLAAASPEGYEMVIHVITRENYWPLPWYLRRFNRDHVGYWQDTDAWARDTAGMPPPSVIILTEDAQPAVDAALRAGYNRQMMFGLRPGVLLSVYVRDDLWQAFTAAAGTATLPSK